MQDKDLQTPQLIYLCMQASPWGNVAIGMWQGKICHLSFALTKKDGHKNIQSDFPFAQISESNANPIDWTNLLRGNSHYDCAVFGSEFQKKVWNEIQKIPEGKTVSYHQLAVRLKQSSATRAVATAVGQNKISLIIPCHRIVHASGTVHKYRWGEKIKKTLLTWEKDDIANMHKSV